MTSSANTIFDRFCPMHVQLNETGHIAHAGPTFDKLMPGGAVGKRFLELVEVLRPRSVTTFERLKGNEGRKLHMRLRNTKRSSIKGILSVHDDGRVFVNLSFGIGVIDSVRDYALTSTDFAPTDLAVEMLYLMEAKSAAMDASRSLNTRLQGAKIAAEEQAFTDTLTGLRNRRALDHILERIGRNRTPYSLMHIDLDWFKQVNDTYGHAAGDHVLRVVSNIMLEETRKNDTVARIGGDEFVIVISNDVAEDRLARLAERLISRMATPIDFEGATCQISASIGIAVRHDGEANDANILEDADAALYEAKRSGRAQYKFHSALTETDDMAAPRAEAG